MAIDAVHLGPGTQQPLTNEPTAAPQWHAWMRILALTVLAVGLGLTLATTTAQAAPNDDDPGSAHSKHSQRSTEPVDALAGTSDRVTKRLSSHLDETTNQLSGQSGRSTQDSSGNADSDDNSASSADSDETDANGRTSTEQDSTSDPAPATEGSDADQTDAADSQHADSPVGDNGADSETGTSHHADPDEVADDEVADDKADDGDAGGGNTKDDDTEAAAPQDEDNAESDDPGSDSPDQDHASIDAVRTAEDLVSSVKINNDDSTDESDTIKDQSDTTDHESGTTRDDPGPIQDSDSTGESDKINSDKINDDHNNGESAGVVGELSEVVDQATGRDDAASAPDDQAGKDSSTSSDTARDKIKKASHPESLTDVTAPETNASDPADDTSAETGRKIDTDASEVAEVVPSGTDAAPETVTVGEVVDDSVLTPAADLVESTGTSRPTTTLVQTGTDLLSSAAEPSQLASQVFNTVSQLTPSELRPVVDQVGDTSSQVTEPVTAIADSAVQAADPVIPVRDVVDSVTTPLRKAPTDSIDAALPALTEPVAQTVAATGGVVRSTAAVPVPRQVVDDLGSGLGDVSGTVGLLSREVAGGLAQVSGSLKPATDAVGVLGDGVSAVIGATGDQVLQPLSPVLPLPIVSGPSGDDALPGLQLPILQAPATDQIVTAPTRIAPASRSIVAAAGLQRLVPPTSALRVDGIRATEPVADSGAAELSATPLSTLSLTDLQLPERIAGVTPDAPGEVQTAVEADALAVDVPHGSDTAPTGNGVGSGSAAGSNGTGGAQPAAAASWPGHSDFPGVLPHQWDDENGTTTSTFDPGFSPD